MKRGQLIGIGVAGGAALIAFLGMKSLVDRQPERIVTQNAVDTVEVLVAGKQIDYGETTQAMHLKWQKWPKDLVSPGFITKDAKPKAQYELAGKIARSSILSNEPVTEAKLGGNGGLSGLLTKGMRAIATEISEITAVGKLIVPNDHVDVMVTQAKRGGEGDREFATETLFRNVRVLAIGKKINVENKEQGADGRVATLELTPHQAEALARANEMGKISLALRSIADADEKEEPQDNRIRVFKGANIASY